MNKTVQLDMFKTIPTPGERWRAADTRRFPDAVVIDVETRYPRRNSNMPGPATFVTFIAQNDQIKNTWMLEDFSRRYVERISA
jgi:hypothetical protein